MSRESSLTQSGHSVRQALTAYKAHTLKITAAVAAVVAAVAVAVAV
jgi:hypothetical protein